VETRVLGKNGPIVSAIGLGCMRMSNFTSGKNDEQSDNNAMATIHAALDAGINLLNTGDFYGMGHNETVVGKAIKDRRDKAFVTVKFGALRGPDGSFMGADCRPQAVKNFVCYSMQRLGIDVIDMYQSGRADPKVPYEETVGAIADLIKQGYVRYLGVSEVTADNLKRAASVHPITALEIEYSLATRFIELEILPTARQLGVGVVAYNVLGLGLLSGEIKGKLPADDFRRHIPRFADENLAENLKTTVFLEEMAQEKRCTPSQLAVAWVLTRGKDIVPLVGMSRPARVAENLKALEIKLHEREIDALDQAFAIGSITGDRQPEAIGKLSAK
jgi:aryl-alcohol dehydrogenase-like predicted oxidoreductase